MKRRVFAKYQEFDSKGRYSHKPEGSPRYRKTSRNRFTGSKFKVRPNCVSSSLTPGNYFSKALTKALTKK